MKAELESSTKRQVETEQALKQSRDRADAVQREMEAKSIHLDLLTEKMVRLKQEGHYASASLGVDEHGPSSSAPGAGVHG